MTDSDVITITWLDHGWSTMPAEDFHVLIDLALSIGHPDAGLLSKALTLLAEPTGTRPPR